MGIFFKFIAIFLFVLVFVFDLSHEINGAWYVLLLIMVGLLFEKDLPLEALTKSLERVITAKSEQNDKDKYD